MHAKQLAEKVPTVRRETTGAEAARIAAEFRLSAIVVDEGDGIPIAVIPSIQLLSIMLPRYLRDDPKLAHALDEKAADALCSTLNTVTIGDLIAEKRLTAARLPTLRPEDTVVELVSAMDTGGSPMIVIRGHDGVYHGVVTMSRLMAVVAKIAGQDSDLVRQRLRTDIIDRGPSGVLTEGAAAGGDTEASGQ